MRCTGCNGPNVTLFNYIKSIDMYNSTESLQAMIDLSPSRLFYSSIEIDVAHGA